MRLIIRSPPYIIRYNKTAKRQTGENSLIPRKMDQIKPKSHGERSRTTA